MSNEHPTFEEIEAYFAGEKPKTPDELRQWLDAGEALTKTPEYAAYAQLKPTAAAVVLEAIEIGRRFLSSLQ